MPLIRRVACLVSVLALVTACTSPQNPSAAPSPTQASPQAEEVLKIVRDTMSMTGVPATTDMHFRNGAVAISYVAVLRLKLVEDGKVALDDKLSTWLPQVPHSDRVTLRQLAQMTSGYVDYVIGNDAFEAALYRDPFTQYEPEGLLGFATSKPLLYEPGTNWNYAHTNYVLLGMALEKATGEQMPKLLQDNILGPLKLTNTANSFSPAIPEPVLHAFTSERRAALGIGSGQPLSPESYALMTSTDLRGKTHAQTGCATCAAMGEGYTYGYGLVISGHWLLQNPLFAGEAAAEAYLPSKKIAIATAVTYQPAAFDDQGNYTNVADALFRKIGAELPPDDAPPLPPAK